ncbi:MAG TPA: EAL domain-containing protein [Candidatus Sulfotelmatobacter sp.]|nr:EAL domain-containing protein [Candidatus Sulfotelmatobacter sp.]
MECPKIARALAWLLLATGSVWAQEYGFRTLGTAEGLNNLAVRQVYQDRGGFIWVSTENGIFRYDGDRFESFGPAQGIPISSVAAFGEAPDGSLLAGGAFGLYRLRGNSFEKLPVPFKVVSWAQGIQSDGKGHTFVGTDSGLMELHSEAGHDGFGVHQFPQAPGSSGTSADGVLVDGDILWYGCGQELCRMDADGTRVFGKESGLPGYSLMVIRKDHEGNLWVRAKSAGVFVRSAGQTKFRRPPELSPIVIGIPAVDADGRILLPSPDGLLIREGKGWQKIDRSAGLRGAVYSVFEDRQHSLWIGLAGRGLAQWRGYHEWKTYSTASGLASDIVYEIQPQADGTLWVGTEGGLLRGERGASGIRWKKVAGLDGFPVHGVRLAPDGDLWIGTEAHGVVRLRKDTGKFERFGEAQGLAGQSPYVLRFDHQQRLWAATEAGLFLSTAPYQKFSRVAEVPSNQVWAVAEGSDGSIWVGGADGLFVFANGRWTNFTHDNGLSNQEVLALGAGANGEIWVGYRFGGGIDRVHLQAGNLIVEKGVQRPGTDGLVYFLEFDAAGRLWAGTERGVDMWNGSRWSHYDTSDGLAWNDCDLNGFAEESDGTVWIGTSGGLSQFKPRPHSLPEVPIEVVFTKLVMGGRDVSGQSNPSFNVHANSLIAHYAALNVSNDNRILFRYQLKGANSSWTETTQRELQFAELAPGVYHLEVEAQGGDGVWSERKAEFGFSILTPWYASWWFFGMCGLAPVLIAGTVVRLRIRSGRRRERELQQLKAAHDEITNLAFYDPLTGLPNRRLLLDRLRQTLAASIRNNRKRALLFVDLDDFKTLNDTLGHHIGDLLLQEVARRIVASIRETDTVARLGGDEFVVLLQDLSELAEDAAAQAKTVAEKILATIHEPYMLDGRECRSSSSIGITVFGRPQDNTNEVLQQADIAMYRAKAAGRNTLHFFAPALQAAVNARAAMEEDLRQAIKTRDFRLYYQAQVEGGTLTGAEALLRWKHPKRGYLPPDEFIPLAEQTGLILTLGDWVLETACQQMAAWAAGKNTAHLTVAVNISARQLLSPDFVQKVLTTLERTGANPKSLKLELTESMFVNDLEDVVAKMTELKSHGLRFALDDFGMGYSSLAYLRRLPLDQLKIDQEFVREILVDPSSAAIAQSIISLSKAMGLSVIAEGVETEGQREFLARLGCHSFQGFLVSGPVPLEDFELLLPALARSAAQSQR